MAANCQTESQNAAQTLPGWFKADVHVLVFNYFWVYCVRLYM